MKVAVIGAGVAGLGAAWLLEPRARCRGLRAREPVRRPCLHGRCAGAGPQPAGRCRLHRLQRAQLSQPGRPVRPSRRADQAVRHVVRRQPRRRALRVRQLLRQLPRAAPQHGAAVLPAHDARHPALQPAGAPAARQVRGPRLHDRRLRRRCGARPGLPRPLPGADGRPASGRRRSAACSTIRRRPSCASSTTTACSPSARSSPGAR